MAAGELEALRPAIDRHFAHASVEKIVASLEAERDDALVPWATRTLEAMARKSPTMLKVSLEQIRRGRALSLAECFRMELELIHGAFEHGDFIEGVRALIVEKDNQPRWSPPSLARADDASVKRFFGPRWSPAAHPLAHLHASAT